MSAADIAGWSGQQSAALLDVKAWLALEKKKRPQIFRIFGFAGTGKTTLAKEMRDMVKGYVLFMSFTGKAAQVLRNKGCAGATTIHSSIYKPVDLGGGQVEFRINRDSAVSEADLLVVDEVSFVDEKVGKDLLSFGKPILVLGDPEQLPPIEGAGYFTSGAPDVMLTEIHRQARDNPIIQLSIRVREGERLRPGAMGESRVLARGELADEDVMDADQALVGMNNTRTAYNRRIRRLRGMQGPFPEMGDRLVCLKNKHDMGLLNGSLWTPKTLLDTDADHVRMNISSLESEGTADVEVRVPNEFFLGTDKDMPWEKKRGVEQFTYGWALTCHKAQGSSWPNVFIKDESFIFRENARRWLYTAITRASERVTIALT